MLYQRLAARPRDADHVEPRVALMQLFLTEKELSRLNHLMLFSKLNGLEGCAEAMISTSFNLDEYNNAPVQDDQVYLSRGAAVVSLDDPVSLFSKILFRDPLSFLPQQLPGVIHSSPEDENSASVVCSPSMQASRTGLKLRR